MTLDAEMDLEFEITRLLSDGVTRSGRAVARDLGRDPTSRALTRCAFYRPRASHAHAQGATA